MVARMDLMRAADRSWPVLRRLMAGHTAVYRATRGVVGHKFPGSPPTLLLDHVGAKSGKKRTSPLVYTRDGDDIVLVASKGGNPKNPAWFHNLKANPETTVQIGSEKREVRAHVATDEERKRLWPMVVDTYSGYDGYQKRTDRKIPLVVLERR
jgi:F420H(2)-dependent quinone reductase